MLTVRPAAMSDLDAREVGTVDWHKKNEICVVFHACFVILSGGTGARDNAENASGAALSATPDES